MPKTDQQTVHEKVLETVAKFQDESIALLTQEAIDVYLFLRERFRQSQDIQADYIFQFVFRSYYRMNNAGLTEGFKTTYFEVLQSKREQNDLDCRAICQRLFDPETRRQRQSLQFSFATKLIATINPDRPIYDSLVAAVFGFHAPYHIKDFTKRLEEFMGFYDSLCETALWLADQERFVSIATELDKRLKNWHQVPRIKQVDFVFWATGKAIGQD